MEPDDTSAASSRRALRRSLEEVASRAQGLTGADGAGATVLLESATVFAGSNAFTDAIDAIQYDAGEGPCLLSVESRSVVRSSTIGTAERRWPSFSPQAAACDLRSVVSVPILAAAEVVGSLNLYGRRTDTFAAVRSGEVERLGVEAGPMLRAARLLALAEMSADSFAAAVTDRAEIERGIGLLMDRYTMSASQAKLLLSQVAAQGGVSMVAAAGALNDADPA